MSITLTDYIDGEQHLVIPGKVINRINELRTLDQVASNDDGQLSDDEREELNLLTDFVADVERQLATGFDTATIVPDVELAEFLRFEAEENGDIPESLAEYVDWEKFAADNGDGFVTVSFGDEESYLVRGR